MKSFVHRTVLFSFALALLLNGLASAQEAPPPANEPQVQARGPVHEAFARPADSPKASPVVPTEPPAPIQELPPLQRPDLPGVQWVSGYWSYNDEAQDFLWVSGTWRVPPPGRQWVAGNWTKLNGGYQWQHGFWGPNNSDGVKTLDSAPPPSLEIGPSAPPPTDSSYYTPGQWVYQDGAWLWQPGSWVVNRDGQIYVPPEYLPCQDGSLYVPGYWDYPLEDRGLLFAPVAFGGSPWIDNPGWCYRPSFTVGLNGLFGSLFNRANTGSYYYGNYYGNGYRAQGYRPWTNYGRRGYDPLLNYYTWSNRGTPNWNRNLTGLYTGRMNGSLPAPATTYAQQLRANSNVDASLIAPNTAAFGRHVTVNPVNSLQTIHALSQPQGRHVRLTDVTATDLASRPTFASRQSFSSSPATNGRSAIVPAPQVRSTPAAARTVPVPSLPQGGGLRTPTLPNPPASVVRPPVTPPTPRTQPTLRAQSPSAPSPSPPIVSQRTPTPPVLSAPTFRAQSPSAPPAITDRTPTPPARVAPPAITNRTPTPPARVAPPAITNRTPTPPARVAPQMHAAPARAQPSPAVRSTPVQRPVPGTKGNSGGGRKR